ncbi:hypothetical protein L249_7774 [Ophiocordyceps polyrhachis-furcata BCC 54312]|uniref:Uncharacterized protein n=1 Tax=Ophiocordyceps polyrhachis-furcata BCC 54312 TaxID=1330021 RepID=A0A367LAN9_9HYPO|nr:hypothetical protein L249_7774 [Ophiocordyceps polyrhachis-furcata BCC 54312]
MPSAIKTVLIATLVAVRAAARPETTSSAPAGSPTPFCECGYTYCGSVLMAMDKPWTEKQLAEAYCKTPKASCSNGRPASDARSALYLCLCEDAGRRVGNRLHLLCGCDSCLVVGPDYRGRCETPCHAGGCAEGM